MTEQPKPGERKIPSPDELKSEVEELLKRKYGAAVQVMAAEVAAPPRRERRGEGAREEALRKKLRAKALRFDLKPKEVTAYLDQYVIRQEEAKKALAIAVCDHYGHVRELLEGGASGDASYSKQNVLLLGPTGVGKTYLIRKIADLVGVPFVKADATRFSETGYVGANVDDLVRDLVTQAGGDLELARYGIVYLDEADKLATPASHGGRDVSGRGVQFGLLKLMEDTDVDLRASHDMASQMQAFMEMQQKGKLERKVVNTRHILFIVSGAFTGMEEIVRKRLNQRSVGISASLGREDRSRDEILRHATTRDYIDFGFEPEFIGRLPIRETCHALSAEDLYRVLRDSKGSVLRQYKASFRSYGIEALFADDAIRLIAEKAAGEKTGARGLMTVCERVLRDFKYELPSAGITELAVTAAMVEDPRGELARLLLDPTENRLTVLRDQLRRVARAYGRRHGFQIEFDPAASTRIGRRALDEKRPVREVLDAILRSYEHGLNLVRDNSGTRAFVFPEEMALDPEGYLERLVRESYAARASAPREPAGLAMAPETAPGAESAAT